MYLMPLSKIDGKTTGDVHMLESLIRLEYKRQALRGRVWNTFGGSSLLAIGVFHIFASLFFMPPMAVAGLIAIGLGILLLFTIVLAPVSWLLF